MIHLRSAVPADAEAMAALEARSTSHPWSAGQYRDALQAGYVALLQLAADQPTGQILAMRVLDEAEILNLVIDRPHQGKGLGKQLLQDLLHQLRSQGCVRVYLEVRESNHPARQLYAQCGFCATGLRKHYYPTATGREHAILMEVQL